MKQVEENKMNLDYKIRNKLSLLIDNMMVNVEKSKESYKNVTLISKWV